MNIVDSLKALIKDLSFLKEEPNEIISGETKTELDKIIRFLNKESLVEKE